MLDGERAARTSGSRFVYLLGDIVQVQFALVRHALDLLTAQGFVPVIPPVLVREEAMFGSGFLPTDEVNIYVTTPDELYLVGTSEVSLAAFHATEILDEEDLPIRYAGYSTCFRREAGTYGKDMGGMFRVHQFDKVEMFSFARPEDSWDEHEFMVGIEEEIVGTLDLPYRIVNVAAGDLGGAAAKKYDLEVWLPGQGRYRELTSCSNYTDYGARRGQTRVRRTSGEVEVLHTLNGTATAIGRTLIAILENYQRADGTRRAPHGPARVPARAPPRAPAKRPAGRGIELVGVDAELAEDHPRKIPVAALELAVGGDVDRDPLPEPRPALVVADQHGAAVQPDDPAVGADDPELLVEDLARLLGVCVRGVDAFAILGVHELAEVGGVRAELLAREAEDLFGLGAQVREPGLVGGRPGGLDERDRRDLFDQGAVARLEPDGGCARPPCGR